jgi:hypothetical protein
VPFAAWTAFGFALSAKSSSPLVPVPLVSEQMLRWQIQAQRQWLKEDAFSFETPPPFVVLDERAWAIPGSDFRTAKYLPFGNMPRPGTFGNRPGWNTSNLKTSEPEGVQS